MSEETIHESSETRSRNGIASYFRRLARRFATGEPAPADEEQTVTVSAPPEADLETEVEREGERLSLEIEVAWAEEAGAVDTDAAASKATFELYEDSAEEWRWRLVHDNGNVIADSGEGYSSKQKVRQGITSVKDNAGPASYLQFDPASFEIYRDKAGEWRFRLLHRNGNILAAASEGYSRRRDAKRAVESFRGDVSEDRFEVYEDNRGEFRWRWRAANGEIVATSGEGYNSKSDAEEAVERIERLAPAADALDVGLAAFEVFEDSSEEWRWRLRHRNGNVIADSGEGYVERNKVHDAIDSVKRNAPGADVE